MSKKKVGVFLSANDVADIYRIPIQEMGTILGQVGFDLIFGASYRGMMKVIAQAAIDAGAQVRGITIPDFEASARPDLYEVDVAKTLTERKHLMIESSDAILICVGGSGTFDEFMEAAEYNKLQIKKSLPERPIIILNTNNYYEGFITQMNRMEADGFIRDGRKIAHIADTPQEVMELLKEFAA